RSADSDKQFCEYRGIIGDYFFIEPFYSFYGKAFSEQIELGLFLCIGISVSILSQARLSLEAKRQQLLASEREARGQRDEPPARLLPSQLMGVRKTVGESSPSATSRTSPSRLSRLNCWP